MHDLYKRSLRHVDYYKYYNTNKGNEDRGTSILIGYYPDTGVDSGSTMIHPIHAIIQFSTTMVDVNCLQSKESNYMEDCGFEAKKPGFDLMTGNY